MSTVRNTLLIGAIVAALSAGTVEAVRAFRLQAQLDETRRAQPPLPTAELRRELDDLAAKQAVIQEEHKRLVQEQAELLALRRDATLWRKEAGEFVRLKTTAARLNLPLDDWRLPRLDQVQQALEQMPASKISELQLLDDLDWLGIAESTLIRLDSEEHVRESLCVVRDTAKFHLMHLLWKGLEGYTNAHSGRLPSDLAELKPHFPRPVDDALLAHYRIVLTGEARDLGRGKIWVTETRPPVDEDHDHLFEIEGSLFTHYRYFNAAERERQALKKLSQ